MHAYSVYIYKSIEIYLYRRKHIRRLAPKQEKKEEKMEITHTHTKLPIIPSTGRKYHHTNQAMAQNT